MVFDWHSYFQETETLDTYLLGVVFNQMAPNTVEKHGDYLPLERT
jgi:hypothetical protein